MAIEVQFALAVICCVGAGFALGVYFRPSYYITVKAPDVTVYLLVKVDGQGRVQEWRFIDEADWWKNENGGEHPRGEEPT